MDVTGRLKITSSGIEVLVVSGELDLATSAELDERLNTVAAASPMSLDLAGVSFIDSSGLRVLLEHHNRLEAGGGRLDLVNISTHTARLLEIAGLQDHLNVTKTT
jgi:anti-sigma B factor antagonist